MAILETNITFSDTISFSKSNFKRTNFFASDSSKLFKSPTSLILFLIPDLPLFLQKFNFSSCLWYIGQNFCASTALSANSWVRKATFKALIFSLLSWLCWDQPIF